MGGSALLFGRVTRASFKTNSGQSSESVREGWYGASTEHSGRALLLVMMVALATEGEVEVEVALQVGVAVAVAVGVAVEVGARRWSSCPGLSAC